MILAAAAAVLLWRTVLFDGSVPLFGNLLLFYHPLSEAVTRQLQAGTLPLWNPLEFSGLPLMADPQSGALALTQLPLRLFGFAWGLRLALALEAALAGCFSYLLARRLGARPSAALLGSLAFSSGGFLFSHAGMLAHTASICLMPAALLFWASGAWALLGAALALQFMGGHPFFVYITLACGLLLRIPRPSITLALAAVQLLPMVELFSMSVRRGSLSAASLFEYSVPPDHLWRMLVLPWWNRDGANFTGDPTITSFYVGLPVVVLALLARRRGPAIWAAGGLALMCGAALPLYPALLKAVPGLSLFRFPAQWGAAAALGLGLCAALAAQRLSRGWRLAALAVVFLDLWVFLGVSPVARVKPEFLWQPPAVRAERVAHSPDFFSAALGDVPPLGEKTLLMPSHGTVFGIAEVLSDNICRPRALDALVKRGLGDDLLRRLGVSAFITPGGARRVKDPLPSLRIEPKGDVVAEVSRPDRLSAVLNAPEGGSLLRVQGLFPGWRAWVDGRPAALRPYEGAFQRLELPPGARSAGLRYEPAPFGLGLALTLAALTAGAGAAILRLRDGF